MINNKIYKENFPILFNNCSFSKDFSRFSYKFIKDKNIFFKIDNKTYGPYEKNFINEFISKVAFTFDNSQFVFLFSTGSKNLGGQEKYYLQINENILGPFEKVNIMKSITENNGISFIYDENNKGFVKIDKKIYGPFDQFFNISQIGNYSTYDEFGLPQFYGSYKSNKDKGKYINFFSYKKEGKNYLNFDGKEFGPYNGNISGIGVSSDENKIAVVYIEGENSFGGAVSFSTLNLFVQVDDKKFGPYSPNLFTLPIFSPDNSKVTFVYYHSQSNKFYIKDGERDYGPYDLALISFYDKKGNIVFTYTLDGKEYYRIGEKVYGPYEKIIFANIDDLEKKEIGDEIHIFQFKKNKNWYLKTPQKIYGPYDDLTFRFLDENKLMTFYLKGNKIYSQKIEIK